MSGKVAIVTGANKGIGYAIVQSLCKLYKGDVFLTGRNTERCLAAVGDLKKENLRPKYHPLDINHKDSVIKLHDCIQNYYDGIDVLVNNAGISKKGVPFNKMVSETCHTNFFGTLNVCDQLFPLLKPHARVVNISSISSQSSIVKCSADMKAKFTNPLLTMEELKCLMQQFIAAADTDHHLEEGFSDHAYGMSKVGVTVMSFIQQKKFNSDSREDLIVNACCPGYVATDLNQHEGPKTIQEGADTPVYLALLPRGSECPKGNFVRERQILRWGL